MKSFHFRKLSEYCLCFNYFIRFFLNGGYRYVIDKQTVFYVDYWDYY
jgi:hypothetical protein